MFFMIISSKIRDKRKCRDFTEGYSIESKDIVLDKNNILFSKNSTIIKDVQNNEILLENFNYQLKEKN